MGAGKHEGVEGATANLGRVPEEPLEFSGTAVSISAYTQALPIVAKCFTDGVRKWRNSNVDRSLEDLPLISQEVSAQRAKYGDGADLLWDVIDDQLQQAALALPETPHAEAALLNLGFKAIDDPEVLRHYADRPAEKLFDSGPREHAAAHLYRVQSRAYRLDAKATQKKPASPSRKSTLIAAITAVLFEVERPLDFVARDDVSEKILHAIGNASKSEPSARSDANDIPSETDTSDGFEEILERVKRSIGSKQLPEVVFAVARPVGAEEDKLLDLLADALKAHEFHAVRVQVKHLIARAVAKARETDPAAPEIPSSPPYEQRIEAMRAGDYIRVTHESGAATAALVAQAIANARPALQAERLRVNKKGGSSHRGGIAYIVTHLMHPEEVKALRDVYDSRFFLIGVFRDESTCRKNILTKIRDGEPPSKDNPDWYAVASPRVTEIIEIDSGNRSSDSKLATNPGSLSLNSTFQLADFFIKAERGEQETKDNGAVARFMKMIFDSPFEVLHPEELAMGLSYLTAKRSSALARRVGAVLVDTDHRLLSVGWNDPVKRDGLSYGDDDGESDFREHQILEGRPDRGRDVSDDHRLDTIRFLLEAMRDMDALPEALDGDLRAGLLQLKHAAGQFPDKIDTRLVAALSLVASVAPARVWSLIEFGRCVHAEMMAISDAAIRGVSTRGATLYVTTMPCHECARNIIAAGIHQVRYIEPYSKSIAHKLYQHEAAFYTSPRATTPAKGGSAKVAFMPYEGLAPRAVDRLFSWKQRKRSIKDYAVEPSVEIAGQAVPSVEKGSSLRETVLGYPSNDGPNFYYEAALRLREAEFLSRFPFVADLELTIDNMENSDIIRSI